MEYNAAQKLIHIKCGSMNLTEIHNFLNDPTVLKVEESTDQKQENIWILNAGIEVGKDASLIIDSNDTSWLKIVPTPTIQVKKPVNVTEDTNYSDDTLTIVNSTNKPNSTKTFDDTKIESGTITVSKNNGENPNGVHVHGSLKIDSVKITSWDPEKNDVIRFNLGKRLGEEHTKSDYDTAEPRHS